MKKYIITVIFLHNFLILPKFQDVNLKTDAFFFNA